MYNITQLDIICFAQHKKCSTSLMHCNHSWVSAVSPDNAPGIMYVIEFELSQLHTESDWYHSDVDLFKINMILILYAFILPDKDWFLTLFISVVTIIINLPSYTTSYKHIIDQNSCYDQYYNAYKVIIIFTNSLFLFLFDWAPCWTTWPSLTWKCTKKDI